MRVLISLLMMFLIAPFIAAAQIPTPKEHPVKAVEIKKEQVEANKKKLQNELKQIKTNLSQQRKKLISVAKDIKKNEKGLLTLENKITKKENEQAFIENKLTEDKKSISDLVLALQRISRVPPEAIIARPESPLKTAQSTMLLQSILPRIYKRAALLKTDLQKLEVLISDLKEDRNKAITLAKKLQVSQKSLSNLMTKREQIYARTEQDIQKQKSELKQISQQANNLKELVRKIEEKRRREQAQAKKAAKAKTKLASTTQRAIPKQTPMPKSGAAQLPASGTIFTGYGNTDSIGAVSEGLKIKTRPKALIVAPMGGIVDYAGNFKGYGKIIILKHAKGYHSLIAGLSKIDTVVGRAVVVGEPIGKMASSGGETSRTLYYELRYKGRPVNPSKKIAGLK